MYIYVYVHIFIDAHTSSGGNQNLANLSSERNVDYSFFRIEDTRSRVSVNGMKLSLPFVSCHSVSVEILKFSDAYSTRLESLSIFHLSYLKKQNMN